MLHMIIFVLHLPADDMCTVYSRHIGGHVISLTSTQHGDHQSPGKGNCSFMPLSTLLVCEEPKIYNDCKEINKTQSLCLIVCQSFSKFCSSCKYALWEMCYWWRLDVHVPRTLWEVCEVNQRLDYTPWEWFTNLFSANFEKYIWLVQPFIKSLAPYMRC